MRAGDVAVTAAILVLITGVYACTLGNDSISAHMWKVQEPCGLPDVLLFDPYSKNTRLIGDTIYHSLQPIALVIQREYRLFADNRLWIVNIASNDTGVYCPK